MSKIDFISKKLKRRHFIWVAVIIVLIGIGMLKFLKLGTKTTATNEHITFEAKQGPLQISVIDGGAINPRELAIIKSEVEGRATILTLVEEGTQVKKGDLVAALDPSTYQADVDRLSAEVASSKAVLERAVLELDRQTKLLEEGWVTKARVETVQAAESAARAAVARSRRRRARRPAERPRAGSASEDRRTAPLARSLTLDH